eukprot:TRINITY_DN20933_c1_g1_i1.p2 TRINITY_DN20933_c1_g1~~TRINITY_DN20933_c1_g1_i1.p2  ORF type:complete len:240 (-),score=32.94 TRINITY_DN20933_c1_g1_i1:286-1005(-)
MQRQEYEDTCVREFIDSKISKRARNILNASKEVLVMEDAFNDGFGDRKQIQSERNMTWRMECFDANERPRYCQPQYDSNKFSKLSKTDIEFLVQNEITQNEIFQKWKTKKDADLRTRAIEQQKYEQEKNERLQEEIKEIDNQSDQNVIRWLYNKAQKAREDDLNIIRAVMSDVQEDYMQRQRRYIEKQQNLVRESGYLTNTVPKQLFDDYEEGDYLDEHVPRVKGKRTVGVPSAMKKNM